MSRYGTTDTVQVTDLTCLWYGAWRTDTVRVNLVRDTGRTTKTSTARGYDIALVTTDLIATPAQVIARYAARWSIEVTFSMSRTSSGSGKRVTASRRPCNGRSPSDCSAIAS